MCAGVGIEVTDVTDEEPAHEAGALREAGGESLKEALDKITAEVIEKLATFGGRVQSVLQGVMKRWKRRIQGLLNPGSFCLLKRFYLEHSRAAQH